MAGARSSASADGIGELLLLRHNQRPTPARVNVREKRTRDRTVRAPGPDEVLTKEAPVHYIPSITVCDVADVMRVHGNTGSPEKEIIELNAPNR
jgi:hypothetical protein